MPLYIFRSKDLTILLKKWNFLVFSLLQWSITFKEIGKEQGYFLRKPK